MTFLFSAHLLLLLWPTQQLERYEFSQPKMGTTFRLVFYTDDAALAERASRAAFQRIDELNEIFSDYKDDSELSRLSQSAGTGEYVKVSDEMWEVLWLSNQIARASNGAFDITAGPLTRLWRRAIRRQVFPDPDLLLEAINNVGHELISFDKKGQRIWLDKEGMRLDAGGIAKGYAVDEAYRVLLDHGIDRALVDGGGDIYAGEAPPGKQGWEVAVTVNSGEKRSLMLRNRAVASSGDTFKYLDWEGKRYSHIVDPRTGLGVVDSKIVNISAPNCTLADALASAVSVSRSETVELLKSYPEVNFISD